MSYSSTQRQLARTPAEPKRQPSPNASRRRTPLLDRLGVSPVCRSRPGTSVTLQTGHMGGARRSRKGRPGFNGPSAIRGSDGPRQVAVGARPAPWYMRGALKKIEIKLKRLRAATHPLPLPRYHSALAAGMDLFADIDEDIALQPLERRAIPTGWALEIPPGFEAQVRPRSGLALKHGITCLNSPGTIDADYRGEVQVILANLSNTAFILRHGERI